MKSLASANTQLLTFQLAVIRINPAAFTTLNSFRRLLKNRAVAAKMGQLLNWFFKGFKAGQK